MKIIRVQNWSQVQIIGEKLILWGFRGQEDASWELETTIHRTARIYSLPFKWLWQNEYWMLRQFQRRAHHYCQDVPDFNQKLDWLALMQHYGAPTRLLDFSHSIYVAAYFALENATKDSAIWAINWGTLIDKIGKHYEVDTSIENVDLINQRHIRIANENISIDGTEVQSGVDLVVHVEPEKLHERLLIQQGFFLFPCNIRKTFKEALAATFNTSVSEMNDVSEFLWKDQNIDILDLNNHCLVKIILPKEIRLAAMKSLNKMNISASTLFPGLDGFARSMKYYISTSPLSNMG